ncbi:MAG: 1-acyl-sn-glycerol-3-phosphate acyltransferase [Prolixibacteraceae bacterium]|nr:1-acyl-sn-glycerol-3-phosphate acyltransferase [Prolixibacteraceae bacterium]MBN2773753.1 1-acyl-sn-glycerol-3-phosphate acyltransferase [Prolixibacteraceae bacterium]
MQKSEEFKRINIREVVADKSPGVAKILPGFVYRYIHRIMHIDYINNFLERHGHLEGVDFVNAVITDFNVTEDIYGFESIPANGRFIFASNHPLGGFDGMLLMKILNGKFKSFKFLSNDVLMNIKQLKPLFVPVNKHGGYAREAAKALHEAYSSDDQITVFPSGLASRKINGKIMDLEWHKHFIAKAIEYKRDVIPVFVTGRNSNRFYRIAKLRNFFRIKWNLEMFFLADETYRHRNKNVTFYFDKPLSYKTFDKSKSHKEWANYVKKIVYSLPDKYETNI